jgi:serine/threonine protein kinase
MAIGYLHELGVIYRDLKVSVCVCVCLCIPWRLPCHAQGRDSRPCNFPVHWLPSVYDLYETDSLSFSWRTYYWIKRVTLNWQILVFVKKRSHMETRLGPSVEHPSTWLPR